MIEPTFVLSAFFAGVLTFLAPCTFPLIPAYLGFISGSSTKELEDPEKRGELKLKIIKNGLFFVLGFSTVFISFGILAGFLGGRLLGELRVWLSRIGGVVVIVFGLFMIGIVKIPFLERTQKIQLPKSMKVGTPFSSFFVGATFAFGWTPCVGPILAAIIALAATSATALQGGLLLAVFSLGLAVPFMVLAIGVGSALKYVKKINRYLKVVSVIGGVFLIIVGILLLTNNFTAIIEFGFRLFGFINYEGILDYL
ncbi:MAG: cytochrome c biogenesis CcdA family protein [Candidatus Dojkabacteria bacterium]